MEEKEQQQDEGEVLTQAIEQITAANIPPTQNDEFNIDGIVQFFDDKSEGKNLLSEGNSKAEFERLLKSQVDIAFATGDPAQVQGILRTLGEAASRIATAQDTDPAIFLEKIVEDIFPLAKLPQFRGRTFQPVDVGNLISTLFASDLDNLQKRDLSLPEIQTIRSEFQTDLSELEESIAQSTEAELLARQAEADAGAGRAEEDVFLFGQNTLLMLQKYLNEHVENNQLRRLLISDVQNLIAQNRQKIGVQLGQAPLQITPISATQFETLRDPLSKTLAAIISPELDILTQEIQRIQQEAISASSTTAVAPSDEPAEVVPNEQDIQRLNAKTLSLVRKYNRFIEKNRVRDPETGELITIATEQREEVFVPPPSEFLQPLAAAAATSVTDLPAAISSLSDLPIIPSGPQFRNAPVGAPTLITELSERLQQFSSPTRTFEFVPMIIRDSGTGQTKEQIVEDLVKIERELSMAKRRMPRRTKTLESSISKRAGLKNILTSKGRRRVQTTTMISGVKIKSHGANMVEIRINKDVTLAELAKISNMIAMENGSLETIDETPLLNIIKGVTPIQEIVNALMSVQKSHAGNDYSVLFVPANVFGSMFIDGPMDVIQKNRMLVSPVGGNIFSSLFNTVGNVVKTVASAPLQLAGAVFGGGVKATAVRADAPQFGASQHIGQEFQRGGSHQPEPFAAVDNQTFHIQPFPFGGRIDNTGFIDQSQVNPKFIWSELPVNTFTNFP